MNQPKLIRVNRYKRKEFRVSFFLKRKSSALWNAFFWMGLVFLPASAAAAMIDMLPDTTDNIHVFQSFNHSVQNLQDEVGKVDFVWGSSFPTEPEGVFNTYYYPYDRVPYRDIKGNVYDLAWFQSNHPDWIVYTCDKITPAWEFKQYDFVPVDITNTEVLEFMMEKFLQPAIDRGFRGIAFDNMVLYYNGHKRCGVWQYVRQNGEWVKKEWKQLYTTAPNDPNFIAGVLNWAKWMHDRLHKLNTLVFMNFPYESRVPQESNNLYEYMDVAVSERGFTNGGDPYLSGEQWLTNMKALQALDSKGKGFADISVQSLPFDQVTTEIKQWVLSNYLLVKGKHSYVAITGMQEYGRILTAPEYSARIGRAVNSMYQSQGVYMRDFSYGKAIVNPSSDRSFIVSLPEGVYKDLYGHKLKSTELKPLSGMVLLKKRPSVSFIDVLLE